MVQKYVNWRHGAFQGSSCDRVFGPLWKAGLVTILGILSQGEEKSQEVQAYMDGNSRCFH